MVHAYGHRGVAGVDAPAMTSLPSGMVDFAADGYYPTPGGLAAHPDLPPPGHERAPASAMEALPGPELVFAIGGAEHAGELDAKRAIDQGVRLATRIEDAAPGAVFGMPVGWQAGALEWLQRNVVKR